MKVFIITEGNSKIGFGHISRCISLSQAFNEQNINPYFIINGDETIKNVIDPRNLYLFDWIKENTKLYNLINEADITIIDSYSFSDLIAKKISKIVKLSVYIDDNNRINYPKGIVVNSSIHAKNLKYINNPEICYLLGTEYSMLRKEFWDPSTKEINKQIETILITLGINDIRNIIPKLLKILNEKFPNLQKKIIVGKCFRNIDKLDYSPNKNCTLLFSLDANEMKDAMLSSDIAITAGGQTSYELLSLGVPSLIIAVADNQVQSVEEFNKLGLACYAGWWENNDLFDNILRFIENLKNVEVRQKIIKKGEKYIKPDGARKIINIILNQFKEEKNPKRT
jgi:UDP-2,4-diacetamido-2,4,6-trideoxy-beta-L-altropyranose hydrolase